MNQNIIERVFLLKALFCEKAYTQLIRHCFLHFGKKSTIIPPLKFKNGKGITIGESVTIDSNSWIQVLPYNLNGEKPEIIIKDYATIGMGATISAAKRIILGEYTLLARNVYISDHGHKYFDIKIPIALQGITEPIDVIIGAHCWIGQNAVILPGVSIGKHCIIGANSVVNKSVPDYSICVGAPAVIVKAFNISHQKWENVKNDKNT
jgi:acetyltransferase-like isoleucine patch superfamily enzyme